MTNKPGQPTKYRPEYCELLIKHMESGMSYESFAGHPEVRVNRDTLYQWEKDQPDFSDAKKKAFEASRFFWDQIALKGMKGEIPNFNSTVWVFSMKNRFGWRDKSEVSNSVTIEDLVVGSKAGEHKNGSSQ